MKYLPLLAGVLIFIGLVALTFLSFVHFPGWPRAERLSFADTLTGLLGLGAAAVALIYAGKEFEQSQAKANLNITFADETTTFTTEPAPEAGGRYEYFILRLNNSSTIPAQYFMAFFKFPNPPFNYRPPITYQTSKAFIPDEYWVITNESNEIQVRVNGRNDYPCPPESYLNLVQLSLLIDNSFRGKKFKVETYAMALNAPPVKGHLLIQVPD